MSVFREEGFVVVEKKERVGQVRKREILDAAKKLFLRKGFDGTVMEDIIAQTSLSHGGVYYHYKNKVEIMHDLMRAGMRYRAEKINAFLKASGRHLDTKALAEMIVDKMLDTSDLMSVYAVYLQAIKTNEELRNLFPVLVEETIEETSLLVDVSEIEDFSLFRKDFLIFLMNTVILGCEILDGARTSFARNRAFFVEIINVYIQRYQEGKIQ